MKRILTGSPIIRCLLLERNTFIFRRYTSRLRPYQQACMDACLEAYKHGHKRQIVSLPVGSGKTVIFSNLISRIPPPSPEATKTLVVAHREELLDQAMRQIKHANPDLWVEIDQGKRHATGLAEVIVASVPSLGRANSARLHKYNPSEFKCIIIDEAHHAAAQSYLRILDHFGATAADTRIFVWGCSATIRRHDGLRLSEVFDYIAYHRDFLQMITEGWLCNVKVTTIKTTSDISQVRTHRSDFREGELSRAVNTPIRNEIVVRSYQKLAEGRKTTLVFATDIAHTFDLCNAFRARGIDARLITSRTTSAERQELLHGFRTGEFPVLVNCGILTEGTDIPTIDCILMARPTKSNVLFQQMLGRGMRLANGKEDCLVLDFVDVCTSRDLVTVPTLLGLDPLDELQGEDLEMVGKELEESDEKEEEEVDEKDETFISATDTSVPTAPSSDTLPEFIGVTLTEYQSPYEIIEDCSGAHHLHHLTPLNWLSVGDGAYILSLVGCVLRLEKEKDGIYRARCKRWYQKKDGSRVYHRPQRIPVEADTLESAIKGCDTWVKRNIGAHASKFAKRQSSYMRQPATPKQLDALKRMGVKLSMDQEKASITKGQAMNLLARLMEGAGKAWREVERDKRREEKERERRRRVEEPIRVGPIERLATV
ncbi:uncharacterized protein VTP21DRAFT_295 [Calcarisporiella thermophila]|uniref:uncharacterized protein n=1 Tax=Calcarisporiella thermophila TaxID=911321 RepID=UPI003742C433